MPLRLAEELERFADEELERLTDEELERLAGEELERPADEELERLTDEERCWWLADEERCWWLADEELERLTDEELERLADEELERLTDEELERLTDEELERLTDEELERLTDEELERLTDEELERLTDEELERLADEELERLADEELERLTDEELERLTDEELERLTDEELERLADEERRWRYLWFGSRRQSIAPSVSAADVTCFHRREVSATPVLLVSCRAVCETCVGRLGSSGGSNCRRWWHVPRRRPVGCSRLKSKLHRCLTVLVSHRPDRPIRSRVFSENPRGVASPPVPARVKVGQSLQTSDYTIKSFLLHEPLHLCMQKPFIILKLQIIFNYGIYSSWTKVIRVEQSCPN